MAESSWLVSLVVLVLGKPEAFVQSGWRPSLRFLDSLADVMGCNQGIRYAKSEVKLFHLYLMFVWCDWAVFWYYSRLLFDCHLPVIYSATRIWGPVLRWWSWWWCCINDHHDDALMNCNTETIPTFGPAWVSIQAIQGQRLSLQKDVDVFTLDLDEFFFNVFLSKCGITWFFYHCWFHISRSRRNHSLPFRPQVSRTTCSALPQLLTAGALGALLLRQVGL